MKKMHYQYEMDIRYSEPVDICHFTIRCIPMNTARQELLAAELQLLPAVRYEMGLDSFGNRYIYGTIREPHDRFVFRIEGLVKMGQILYEEKKNADMTGCFRYPFGRNRSGELLQAYYRQIAEELQWKTVELPAEAAGCGKRTEAAADGTPAEVYARSLELMHRLYRDYRYQAGSTDMNTTAEEAWKNGEGVCQDYAHILIALLQMAGIPARYVAGMIAGEGATHAWVEFLCNDRWIGLDPTHDLLINENYIKLGHGREAGDCMVNRGLIQGGGSQLQEISVRVTEMELI